MAGRIITVSTLVAFAHAKAIITNNCPRDVYIWSVPHIGSAHTANLALPPGSRYEEPWHYGTTDHPGIALKISPQSNGIHESKDEINFAYSIERSNKDKVWVDLSPVRGHPFDNNIAFYTCQGVDNSLEVQTRQCHAKDDIELVLCGGARSSDGTDSKSLQKIADCYDYHQNHSKINKIHNDKPDVEDRPDDEMAKPSCTFCHRPEPTSAKPLPESPDYASHEHTTTTTLTIPGQDHTVTLPGHDYTVTMPGNDHTVTKHTTLTKAGHKHTVTYYPPPDYKTETFYRPPHTSSEAHYKAPHYTSSKHYDPPHYTSSKHYDPPHYTSSKHYDPPHYTSSKHYDPPHYTSSKHYEPPRYSSEKHQEPPHYTSKPYPHEHTSTKPVPHDYTSEVQYEPPHYTSAEPYDPPKYMPEHSYAMPPEYTTTKPYSPPHTDKPYPEPPRYTSKGDYGRPLVPSYHRSNGDWNDDYYHGKPLPTDSDRVSRRDSSEKPYDYCKPRIVHANPALVALKQNSTVIMGRHLTTVPFKTVVRREAMKRQVASTKASQKPSASLVSKKPEKCILPYCHPIQSNLDCTAVKRAFEAGNNHTVDWVQDGTACSSFLQSGNASHVRDLTDLSNFQQFAGVSHTQKRPQVCIAAQCIGLNNRECELLEDLLEELAADRDIKIDYTTDDDACDPTKRKQHIDINAPLSYCHFCEPAIPNQNCQTATAMVNAVFTLRNVDITTAFYGYDWRDENCTLRNEPQTLFHKKPAVCIRPLCDRLEYNNHDCEQIEDELEAATQGIFKHRVDYTTDDDVC